MRLTASQLKKMRSSAQEANKKLKSKLNRLMSTKTKIEEEHKQLKEDLERAKNNYTAANKANLALETKIKKALEENNIQAPAILHRNAGESSTGIGPQKMRIAGQGS